MKYQNTYTNTNTNTNTNKNRNTTTMRGLSTCQWEDGQQPDKNALLQKIHDYYHDSSSQYKGRHQKK